MNRRTAACGLLLTTAACAATGVRSITPNAVTADLLAHPESEASGYAAYSYVIFLKVPDDARSQALLTAYLQYLPQAFAYAQDERKRLDVTYVPVNERPQNPASADAAWLGAHYDLARAHDIAATYPLSGAGPFIVTRTQPASSDGSATADLAVIDLSNASKETMNLWVQHFEHVVTHPDDRWKNGMNALVLEIHDSLKAAGETATMVTGALEDGRKFVKLIAAR